MRNHYPTVVLWVSLMAVVVFLPCCSKKTADTTSSSLLFVNVSLNAPDVDIYTSGNLLYYGLSFPDSTGYLLAAVSSAGLSMVAPTSPDTLAQAPADWHPGQHYSFFVIDSSSGHGGIQVAEMEDSLPVVPTGYVEMRFLNFSLTAPNLDLYTATTSAYLFIDRYYDQVDAYATSFVAYPAGAYSLQLRSSGAIIPIATLNSINLQEGKIYTFFAKGTVGGAGDKNLSIGMVQNN
jgi:hypothetical protein